MPECGACGEHTSNCWPDKDGRVLCGWCEHEDSQIRDLSIPKEVKDDP